MPDRCPWPADDALMIAYHDNEWGVPLHDDRGLYEYLVLDAAQAGLSWRTILHRRAGYRQAFRDFDLHTVAGYGQGDKRQVQSMVRLLLGLDVAPEPSDAADALAVALCHLTNRRSRAIVAGSRTGKLANGQTGKPKAKAASK